MPWKETRLPGTVCPNRCDDLSRPRDPVSIPGQSVQFVWVFAWFYVSSVVSPARRDVFVRDEVTNSYTGAGTSRSKITKI